MKEIAMQPSYVNDIPHCPTCDEALRSYPNLPLSYCSCGVWFENKELGAFDFQPFPKPGTKYPPPSAQSTLTISLTAQSATSNSPSRRYTATGSVTATSG